MKEALQHFLEWHADHFGDFSPAINAELLCLANEASAALEDRCHVCGHGNKLNGSIVHGPNCSTR